MINFIRGILNDVTVSDFVCNRYVIVLSNDSTASEIQADDGITSFIVDNDLNLYPDGIIFGEDRITISTEDPNYTNGIIASSNMQINVYEYNKIFLYDRFKKFDLIINELSYKLNVLGYPQYMMLYKYAHHNMEYIGMYKINYDIKEGFRLYEVYAYINEFDKLKISNYTNI